MMSTVIGGAMLPHAPQFFTMPDTEDKEVVAHVREVAADVGKRLRALKPDLWIIFSNDHAEQFFHTTAPPFTIHVGGEATGEFAGRHFHWKIPSEIAFELVRQLYRQNFDPAFTSAAKINYAIGIPLTHLGHTGPVLPIYVNAYLPPQPTMERCYAFGQAVAHTVTALELKTVILSSGGKSHFPGTDRYSSPELAWDKRLLEKLSAGNLKSPIGYDEDELDNTGIIEFRRADHRSPQNRMWPHRSCSSKPAGSTTTGGFSRPWSSSSPVDALGCLQCPAPCNSMATHPSKGRSAIRVKSPGCPERSQQ